MSRYFSRLILVIALALPLPAWSEVGYSGASWGELRHEFGEDGSNTLLYGWIDQGIDWVEVEGFRLSSYGILRYGLDTDELDYNNYLAPGLGMAIRKGAVKMGLEYLHEWSLESDQEEDKSVLYLNWWVGWDLKKK